MASWLVRSTTPGSSGPSPGLGHCVVFMGKTLNSHSASLYKIMGTGEINIKGNLRWTSIVSREK